MSTVLLDPSVDDLRAALAARQSVFGWDVKEFGSRAGTYYSTIRRIVSGSTEDPLLSTVLQLLVTAGLDLRMTESHPLPSSGNLAEFRCHELIKNLKRKVPLGEPSFYVNLAREVKMDREGVAHIFAKEGAVPRVKTFFAISKALGFSIVLADTTGEHPVIKASHASISRMRKAIKKAPAKPVKNEIAQVLRKISEEFQVEIRAAYVRRASATERTPGDKWGACVDPFVAVTTADPSLDSLLKILNAVGLDLRSNRSTLQAECVEDRFNELIDTLARLTDGSEGASLRTLEVATATGFDAATIRKLKIRKIRPRLMTFLMISTLLNMPLSLVEVASNEILAKLGEFDRSKFPLNEVPLATNKVEAKAVAPAKNPGSKNGRPDQKMIYWLNSRPLDLDASVEDEAFRDYLQDRMLSLYSDFLASRNPSKARRR